MEIAKPSPGPSASAHKPSRPKTRASCERDMPAPVSEISNLSEAHPFDCAGLADNFTRTPPWVV
jgi:hypothetical protein